MSVKVTVLYFDGCPHWQAVLERVRLAADRVGVAVELEPVAVDTDQDVRRLAFSGSPTVLVDGRDPFATSGPAAALACRVYAKPDGPAGAPSVGQLEHALLAAQGPPRTARIAPVGRPVHRRAFLMASKTWRSSVMSPEHLARLLGVSGLGASGSGSASSTWVTPCERW